MVITARYPGICRVCGGAIEAGELIEWARGEKPRHAKCPVARQQTVPSGAPIHVSRGEGYGGRPYTVGQVLRHRDGRVIVVVRARSEYIREDGMSFGVGDEEGHIYSAECRLATEAEIAERVAAETRRTERTTACDWLRALVNKCDGSYEPGEHVLDGEEIAIPGSGDRLYGGGSWITITSDAIWFVCNNGRDGDDWGHNNVRTGGAGAIGRYVARDADLETWIREAVRLAA